MKILFKETFNNSKGNNIKVELVQIKKGEYKLTTTKNNKVIDIIEMDEWFDLENEFKDQVKYADKY